MIIGKLEIRAIFSIGINYGNLKSDLFYEFTFKRI